MKGEFASVSTRELVKQITTLAGHLNAADALDLDIAASSLLERRAKNAPAGTFVDGVKFVQSN